VKTVSFFHAGTEFHLCLNASALFDCYDRFGGDGGLLDSIRGADRESFENLCWMLAKLAEQGELVRRWQGLDRGPVPAERFFLDTLGPMELPAAKAAVSRAVALGFGREAEEAPERVDLGLAALQKKTAEAGSGGGNTCSA